MRKAISGLRIARFQEHSYALGPGVRAVVWFQGCSYDCQGCIAAEMNRSDDFDIVTSKDLTNRILKINGIEGVTLSGGDPFDQPLELLADFLEELRLRSDLSVMCYTGRMLEQLRRDVRAEVMERILSRVDILVDGLYVESLNDGRAWRGSSNQQIHFLSPRYQHLKDSIGESRERKFEVSVAASGLLEITGIPAAGFMERLHRELNSRDLSLEFEVRSEWQSGVKR